MWRGKLSLVHVIGMTLITTVIYLIFHDIWEYALATDTDTINMSFLNSLMLEKDNAKKPIDVQESSLLRNQFVVPNIVHYVWFGVDEPFRFHHWLSIRSADMVLKPEVIMFHCQSKPVGRFWSNITRSIRSLKVVHYLPPTTVLGREITRPEHQVNVASLEILISQGGVYLEPDVLVLRDLTPLRRYSCTMGVEYHGNPGRLNNGVILAAPGAMFLTYWYGTYQNITKSEQDEHSARVPYNLQKLFPRDIHVEDKTMNYPSGKRLDLLYDKMYNYSQNYVLHLWSELHDQEHNPTDIRTMNTTFGQVARRIYYGNEQLIDVN